jgi:hypothetical protein
MSADVQGAPSAEQPFAPFLDSPSSRPPLSPSQSAAAPTEASARIAPQQSHDARAMLSRQSLHQRDCLGESQRPSTSGKLAVRPMTEGQYPHGLSSKRPGGSMQELQVRHHAAACRCSEPYSILLSLSVRQRYRGAVSAPTQQFGPADSQRT